MVSLIVLQDCARGQLSSHWHIHDTMKRQTAQGLALLSSGALCYSTGSLCFAKSAAQSSQVNTWVGILGTPFCIFLLSLDKEFSPIDYITDPKLYLCLLNGILFGGAAIVLHFWSLEFILPSDNNMIVVFFHIVGSILMQFLEDRQIPSLLTFVSVVLGFIGTFFVCNPKDLFTKNILEAENMKGVVLVALAGLSFAAMYGNSRKFGKISPIWSVLGICFFEHNLHTHWIFS